MKSNSTQKKIAYLLSVLLGLFIFRVFAQVLQLCHPIKWLPPFEAWHSQTLPYPYLLISQLAIIILFAWIIKRFYNEKVTPHIVMGKIYLFSGGAYFLFMIIRLFMGQCVLKSHVFWASTLPTLFHLILALFIIVVGYFHQTHKGENKDV